MENFQVTYHYPKEPHTDHKEVLSLDEIKDLYPNYAIAIADSGFQSLTVAYENITVAFTKIAYRPMDILIAEDFTC